LAAEHGTDTEASRPAPSDECCPRCGRRFHCGASDAAPCACTTLRLSAIALSELRARYDGCLCLDCLQALAHAATAPTSRDSNADRADELKREISKPRNTRAP